MSQDSTNQNVTDQAASIERRLAQVVAALHATQASLQQSMQTIEQLQGELTTLQAQVPKHDEAPPSKEPAPGAEEESSDFFSLKIARTASSAKAGQAPTPITEEVEAIQAEVQQHDQTKVETSSKYPLKVTGLVLFNAFANDGAVDNTDLPSLALPRQDGVSNGSVGGSLRQSIFGIDAHGPHLGGARTSASLSIDFFGDLTSSFYSSSAGSVRLRRAQLSLDWQKTTLAAGIEEPLISPLSPTSYATVALPALSWAGNLWSWAPQVRVERRVPIGLGELRLAGGLFDPLATGLTGSRVARAASPGELTRQPAFEGRVAWHVGEAEHSLTIGMGAYSSEQSYGTGSSVHSWAGTADWSLPLSRSFMLRGEAYRGRALAGLGGGAYKNILTGIDPRSGLLRTNGVDAVGGWSQVTWRPRSLIEVNAALGLDDALASNFRRLQLTASSSDPLQFYARNSMILTNIVFRPKSYLILSPEYRRIRSWQVGRETYDANIVTISAGYEF